MFRVFGGVPGFLGDVPGFLAGVPGFWGVFRVFECSGMFHDVPCSGVPCSGVPVFLEVLHAKRTRKFSLKYT